MKDFDNQLRQWRELESLALAAEEQFKGIQAANSPEVAALARDAADKRKQADEALNAMLSSRKNLPPR